MMLDPLEMLMTTLSELLRVFMALMSTMRRVIWNELVGLISWWNLSWRTGGDLNSIRYQGESEVFEG